MFAFFSYLNSRLPIKHQIEIDKYDELTMTDRPNIFVLDE